MRRKRILIELMKHGFIWIILCFAFFPMYITFAISFKNNKQFNKNPFSVLPFSGIFETFEKVPASEEAYDPKSIVAARDAIEKGLKPGDADWPMVRKSTDSTWHLENWKKAWGMVGGYIFNTIFVAVTAVAVSLGLSLSAAFFFARYRMPFNKFLWYFFLILMLMPGVANLLPLFILMRNLGLLNTLWTLVIVGITGGQVIQIYILRNFIEDIPQDLFDASEIDGATPFQQIIHVVTPLSGSILSTLAILQFLGVWNNFILPFVMIRDDSLLTLAAGLVKLDGEYVKHWGELMAGYSISSLPLVLIFLFTMRFFVKGVTAGAIKG